MTKDIQLCTDDGEKMVNLVAFDTLMRKELRSYAQRSLAACIRKTLDRQAQILLGIMKILLVNSKATLSMLPPANLSHSGIFTSRTFDSRSRSRSPERGHLHPPSMLLRAKLSRTGAFTSCSRSRSLERGHPHLHEVTRCEHRNRAAAVLQRFFRNFKEYANLRKTRCAAAPFAPLLPHQRRMHSAETRPHFHGVFLCDA